MTGGDKDAFVPGINDLVKRGYLQQGILSVAEKMERGKKQGICLLNYKTAKKNNDIRKQMRISGNVQR